jgi:hypothetical protein
VYLTKVRKSLDYKSGKKKDQESCSGALAIKDSLAKIREQLQMSKATLKHVLAHARAHPEQPVQKRKKRSCRVSKVMNITFQAMKR